jgi:hypothetical protein
MYDVVVTLCEERNKQFFTALVRVCESVYDQYNKVLHYLLT